MAPELWLASMPLIAQRKDTGKIDKLSHTVDERIELGQSKH